LSEARPGPYFDLLVRVRLGGLKSPTGLGLGVKSPAELSWGGWVTNKIAQQV